MEGKTLILLLNSRVIHAYLYTFSNVQIYSGQNSTRELYLSIFRGTGTGRKFCCATVLFCIAIVVNDEVLAYFKHDVCIFIHGTSKIECFVICKISFVNVIMLSVNVHV